jgi:HAD superfamily 5'-nucleotidase-like hydrolase
LDAYNNIQMDTVHYGREALVDADKVFQIHGGIHIAPTYIRENMKHLNDFFSLPNACLLADIIQYFDEHNIRFHPRHLVDDLNAAAEYIHSGSAATGQLGLLHQTVLKNIDKYLNASPKTTAYLEKLRRHGKKTFLVTNSGFEFIDKGLAYILGTNEWRSLFDVVIVDSNKPLFYSGRRPFRRIATRFSSTHEPGWQFVDGFQQDEVYQGGNLRDFSAFTGWFGTKSSVIYFGDSIYSDLSEPAALQGWRTACVVLIS